MPRPVTSPLTRLRAPLPHGNRLFPDLSKASRLAGRHMRAPAASAAELHEAEEVKGIRVLPGEDEDIPGVEYLVGWKDGEADTWEPAINLSDDLIRDFDEGWWEACKKADKEAIGKMLRAGGPTLAKVVDEEGRSALHFAAALGSVDIVRMLLAYDADPNLGDKEEYTPLHMAAGYLHVPVVQLLLEAGGDPEYTDDSGRTPLTLLISLRDNLPADNPMMVARRMALEQGIACLQGNLYEDLEPVAILLDRETGPEREFLVQWPDDVEDTWVPLSDMAEDVVRDYDQGLEYCEPEAIVDVRSKGDEREYLLRWKDDYPDSWEAEENVSSVLIEEWEESRRGQGGKGSPNKAAQPAELQPAVA
ncbi:unnamed protein product [Ostreobium quekettii]|uniref:Chromo domain-containing protein n=1 Tax=Ostreobium quekettii TaxID=121088 RepID=A0A8S1JFI2_9CHLO|nr:unnamed protein product [Ostreobium quekettii]|eukprot:evm.model.scf_998EXC.6 EVM.evm.TU.scf_998EXC.6   scf_998EXC:52533-55125(-)